MSGAPTLELPVTTRTTGCIVSSSPYSAVTTATRLLTVSVDACAKPASVLIRWSRLDVDRPPVREVQHQRRRRLDVVHAAEVGLVSVGSEDHVAPGQRRDGPRSDAPNQHGLMGGYAARTT